MKQTSLRCGRFCLTLDRPQIMGIVNLTPDSFSGDGLAGDASAAVAHAHAQIAAGADMLDIGAESSRPGAPLVAVADEIARLLPVLRQLRDVAVPVSVDTCKPEVMTMALSEGAAMINDIAALQTPGAMDALAATQAAVCLMHMRGEPRTMQVQPSYDDVVAEVKDFLARRVDACLAAGIAADRIVIDPGFGFGKSLAHNLTLLRDLAPFQDLPFPLLVGLSRKAMIGTITERPVHERVHGSVAAAMLAVARGAAFVRVHDVAATRDALRILAAVEHLS